jgi:microsomal dipeptidase-like Zn-dependent dipeptidase
MPYFDFHIHPVLKSIFSEDVPPRQKLTPWQKIDESNMDWTHKLLELDKILRSQANLAQLLSENCNLSCVALYAPEYEFVEILVAYDKKNFLKKLRLYIQEPKLQKLLATSHFETLCKEDLVALQDFRLEYVRQSATYQPTDKQKLYLVFSVEGCHTLSSTPRVDLMNPNSFRVDDVLKNLDTLRASLPIVSLNLVHLTQSHLCNHAFGVQMGENARYIPVGKGLTSRGGKVLEHCYRHNIMIDVKHMGIVARIQFYALRNSPFLQNMQQPIVCSHAGFAGISYLEIGRYITKAETQGTSIKIKVAKPMKYGKAFGRPSFNATSINLFDEDIIEILRSGGMIGLSLDKRILGYKPYEIDGTRRDNIPTEIEYISAQEKTFFLQNFAGKLKAIDAIDWDEMKQGELLGLVDYQLQHFIMHIFHLIEVAKRYQYDVKKALKQVCIGSDYEGLINPMLVCATIEDFGDFQQAFEKQFGYLAKDANIVLPAGFDIKAFSQDLFYENGKNFVLQRVNMLQASPSPTPPSV